MQVKNEISKELAKLRPNEKRQGAHHYNMKIMRDGTWFHEGRPIQRHALVKLFSTVLKRDPRYGNKITVCRDTFQTTFRVES